MNILKNFSFFTENTLLDSQIARDFVKEIVEFFRKLFSKSWKRVRKIKSYLVEQNPFSLGLRKNIVDHRDRPLLLVVDDL